MFRFQTRCRGAAVTAGGSRGHSGQIWMNLPLCSGHEAAAQPGTYTVIFYLWSKTNKLRLQNYFFPLKHKELPIMVDCLMFWLIGEYFTIKQQSIIGFIGII